MKSLKLYHKTARLLKKTKLGAQLMEKLNGWATRFIASTMLSLLKQGPGNYAVIEFESDGKKYLCAVTDATKVKMTLSIKSKFDNPFEGETNEA